MTQSAANPRLLSFYTAECQRVHDLLDRLGVPREVGQQTMSQRLERFVEAWEESDHLIRTVLRAHLRK